MSDEPVKTEPSGISEWRWPSVIVLVAALGLVAFIYFIKTPSGSSRRRARERSRWPRCWTKRRPSFGGARSPRHLSPACPSWRASAGGLLELAKVTATETFRSEDERTYGFKWFEVDAGTTITEIRVPVTYRYHLRMRDTWELSVTNNVCIVHAPEIRPSQPAGNSHRSYGEIVERGLGAFQC